MKTLGTWVKDPNIVRGRIHRDSDGEPVAHLWPLSRDSIVWYWNVFGLCQGVLVAVEPGDAEQECEEKLVRAGICGYRRSA